MMTHFSSVFKLLTEFKSVLTVLSQAKEISHMRMTALLLTTVIRSLPLEDARELKLLVAKEKQKGYDVIITVTIPVSNTARRLEGETMWTLEGEA
jgi:hypothetical protein